MFSFNYFKFVVAILGVSTAAGSQGLCQKLKSQGLSVDMPQSPEYEIEQENYWSAACSNLRPYCILSPNTTPEMALIIKEIGAGKAQFAIKSGGHSANNLFASIDDGVLISTRNLDQVVYDPDTQTAVVGPGLKWKEVVGKLEHTQRTVVGGRLGGVGVGGLILGGGLSYLSSQYGWAANNVVNFELVLANGTVVDANATSNSDLFAVLKGGGSNFGVVTAFTLKTHPQPHKVWGGYVVFTPDKSQEVLQAIRDFTEYNTDEKASIIGSLTRSTDLYIWVTQLFYDGPEPPLEVFANFTNIESVHETIQTRSFYDLLDANDEFIIHGKRYTIGSETTPLPDSTNGEEIFQTYVDHWNNMTDTISEVPGLDSALSFQPLTRAITSKAKEMGGDLMDYDPTYNYIIFELSISHSHASSDQAINDAARFWYEVQKQLITQFTMEGKLPDTPSPLYVNDIHGQQDYWGRLSTTEKARSVRRAVDPDLFFQKRTSAGFRLG